MLSKIPLIVSNSLRRGISTLWIPSIYTIRRLPRFLPNIGVIQYPIHTYTQRRLFSTSTLSSDQIIQKIEDCGINDAGKEKVIQNEVKSKNYDNLYNAGEKLLGDEATRELGVLVNVLLADSGYLKSIIELGNMYYTKWRSDKDDAKRKEFADHSLKESISWLQKASQQNDALGKTLLAKVYLESQGKDKVEESLKLLEEAAKQKNADALFNLGLIYYDGLYSIPSDEKKAVHYLEEAAKLNDISSITFMGQYYIVNDIDIPKGLEYLNKSYSMKSPEAALFLSDLYMEGKYVPKDASKAWNYLITAGDVFHDPEALNQIGIAYFTADYEQELDYSKALNYFHQASLLGNSEALKNMGIMYYNGYGVDKNLKKAFEYYTQASEHGDLEALRNIGFMYMTGEGCEKDEKTAQNVLKFVELEEKRQSGNSLIENNETVKREVSKQL